MIMSLSGSFPFLKTRRCELLLITSGAGRVIVSWLDAAPKLTDAASCHLFLLWIPSSHDRGANYSDDFNGECGGCAKDWTETFVL